jgi:hypothetical protein
LQHWDLTPGDEMRARQAQGSLVHLGSEHSICRSSVELALSRLALYSQMFVILLHVPLRLGYSSTRLALT